MAEHVDPSLSELVLNPKSKKIVRPPNAFMIFARENRKIFARQNPNKDNKIISKMLGESWKKMDVQTKREYFKMAKQMELLHKRKYPGYVYSPRIARLEKSKRQAKKRRNRNNDNREDGVDLGEAKIESQSFRSSAAHKKEPKEDEWIPELPAESSRSDYEYVPNNPDYFKNQNEVDYSSSSFLATSQSSSGSSSPDSVYDPTEELLKAVKGSDSNKRSIGKSLPPPLKPYWMTHSAFAHSKCSGSDGFATFPPPSHCYCQEPNFSHVSSTNWINSNVGQSCCNPIPERYSFNCRSSLENDQRCFQRVGFFSQQAKTYGYSHSSLPLAYQSEHYLHYPFGMNWRESDQSLRSEFRHSFEKTSSDFCSGLKGYPPQGTTKPTLSSEWQRSLLPETASFDIHSELRCPHPPEITNFHLCPELKHPHAAERIDLPTGIRYPHDPSRCDFSNGVNYPLETTKFRSPERKKCDSYINPRSPHVPENISLNFSPELIHNLEAKILDSAPELRHSTEKTGLEITPEFKRSPESSPSFPPEFRHSYEAEKFDLPSGVISPSKTSSCDASGELRNSLETTKLQSSSELQPLLSPERTSQNLSPEMRHPLETSSFDFPSGFNYSMEATKLQSPSKFQRHCSSEQMKLDWDSEFKRPHPPDSTRRDLSPEYEASLESLDLSYKRRSIHGTAGFDLFPRFKHYSEITVLDDCRHPGQENDSAPGSLNNDDMIPIDLTMKAKVEMSREVEE